MNRIYTKTMLINVYCMPCISEYHVSTLVPYYVQSILILDNFELQIRTVCLTNIDLR